MNIVMVCRLYAPHIGGVEKHVAGVSKEAIKDGHRVDVFTLKHDRTVPSEEVMDGIRIHRVAERKLSFGRLGVPMPLRMTERIYERLQLWSQLLLNIRFFILADVIQIHDIFFWYWPLRILLPWKKVYVTFHGFEAGSLPTKKAKKTRQMITKWTRGNMAVGSWIEKWYGTQPDVVTYGGGECTIESNKYQRTTNNKKLKCVFVGRIAEDTGAKVYEKVIGSLANCHLDMFGEGSRQGTVNDSCDVFPKYDVACVSSYLAIIEAMQSKTLVIAYAADELKYDYLMAHPRAKDMYIVRNEEELKKTILSLDEGTHAMVTDAYDWAREQTWNRVYRKYLKLWQLK